MVTLRLGVVADPHLSLQGGEASWHNPYRLADAHERLDLALSDERLADVDAFVLLGDLAHFGDRPSIQRCIESVDKTRLGRPAVLISGNHDVLVDDVHLDDELREFAPAFDATSLFAASGLGLRVQDVMAVAREGAQPFDVRARTLLEDGPNGHVVLTHFPVLSLEARARDARMLYAGHLSQLAPNDVSLPAHGPVVVLSGHLHLRGVTHDGDVLQMVFAALVEPPYEFARVEIESDNGVMSVEYCCWSARVPDAPKLPVLDPDQAKWRWTPGQGWSQPAQGHW